MSEAEAGALRRDTAAKGKGPAPVRIVHLGLGAFHRAHQAWYTARSDDANAWGIAAFTGRSPRAAKLLAAQDCLYTLIERSEEGDHAEIIGSISEVHDGADLLQFGSLIAAPPTAVVTLTVTEPGYWLGLDGNVDLADPTVVSDVLTIRGIVRGVANLARDTALTTAPARLLLGLYMRQVADAGPLAVVPCDNISRNGPMLRRVLATMASEVDAGLAAWIDREVSFVSTSVDRITPRATRGDSVIAARLTGFEDATPVVTEPFSDWVLSGEFPSGRPQWETAGARFVPDVEPFEQRKLLLLNGSHSLLAYLGTLRGHVTVADAIAEPECRAVVDMFWAEAARGLPAGLQVAEYCAALLRRFANARIAHELAQIGMEGTAKLAVRIAPVAVAERAAGRTAPGCAAALAAWTRLAVSGRLPSDARGDAVVNAASASRPIRALLALLSPELAADEVFVELVEHQNERLGAGLAP